MAECKNTYEKNIGDAVMLRSYLFGFQASSLAVINYISVYSLLSSSLNWEFRVIIFTLTEQIKPVSPPVMLHLCMERFQGHVGEWLDCK